MLWHDEHLVTNTEDRCTIGVLQREYNGAAIGCINTLEKSSPKRILVKCRILLHQVKGKLDISACQRLSVIPFHVCAQLKGQLRQIAGVALAAGQPGRGLTSIQVCEVELFIQQTLRSIITTLVGVKVWVKEIGIGLPRRRENTKRC